MTPLTARKPLGTLAMAESPFIFSDVDEPGSPSPLNPARRLRRRCSDSPAPGGGAENGSPSSSRPLKRNAFDILAGGAQKAKERKPLKKSEFVEAEAQESDEDDGFGFKKKTADDAEGDSDGDDDKPVEGLVDDAIMDEATLAGMLVQEKYKLVARMRVVRDILLTKFLPGNTRNKTMHNSRSRRKILSRGRRG